MDTLIRETRAGFFRAMDDDLRTHDAVYRLQQMTEALTEIEGLSASEGEAVVAAYRELGGILGIFEALD